MRFLFALILIALGVGVIWKTDWLIRSFGYNGWAEAKLGAGGTWTFYKILGVLLILAGFIVLSGAYTSILDFLFVRG